jgi:hypothetical protein
MGRGPSRRRNDVEQREAHDAHAHHAGDTGHHRLDARDEAADDDALAAMEREIFLPRRQQAAIARERPDVRDPRLEDMAEPKGELVANGGPQGRRDEDRPEWQLAETDEAADANEHDGARHDQADDQQGLTHGDDKGHGDGERRMERDEIEQALEIGRHGSPRRCAKSARSTA